MNDTDVCGPSNLERSSCHQANLDLSSVSNHRELLDLVLKTYSTIAESPLESHPIANGRGLAIEVGYPTNILNQVPLASQQAFSGVSNVSCWAKIEPGQRVLDLGCGAGLDSLVAAGRGAAVTGIDFSSAMLKVARTSAGVVPITNLPDFRLASVDQLPFDDETFDGVLVNGLFNLNPARADIFKEMFRVLKPGGSVYSAEIVATSHNTPASNTENWLA